MNPQTEYRAFLALDWAEEKHAWALVGADSTKQKPLLGTVENSPEAIQKWVQELDRRCCGPIAVAVEQQRGPLVITLLEYPQLVIYPIHGASLANYRKSRSPSGAKSDPGDAAMLVQFLRERIADLKPVRCLDPETTQLLKLVKERRHWVDEKTALHLRLKDVLKAYFPQMLSWFDDLTTPMAAAWLKRWPTLWALKTARPATLRKFFNEHNCRSEELIEKRLAGIAAAVPATSNAAVLESHQLVSQCLLEVLVPVRANIARLDKAIERVAEKHPDFIVVDSFPGAGPALVPRILAVLGSVRDQIESAYQLQCYSGIAPVSESSGQQEWVHFRWVCSKFLRQTFHEWAGHTIGHCSWAREFYQSLRDKCKDHHAAVRALAFKWIRILYRCWQTHTPYDDSLYVAARARRRQSPRNPQTLPTHLWKKEAGFSKLAPLTS
jgi:transposase